MPIVRAPRRRRHGSTDTTGLAYLLANLSDPSKLAWMYSHLYGATFDGSGFLVTLPPKYGATGNLGNGNGTSQVVERGDRLQGQNGSDYFLSGTDPLFDPTVIKTTVTIAALGPRGGASKVGNNSTNNSFTMQALLSNYQMAAGGTFADMGLAGEADGLGTLRVLVATYNGATTATGQVLNHTLTTITPAALTPENGKLQIMRSTNGTGRAGWAAVIGLTALPTAGDLTTFMTWGSTFYGAVAVA